MVPGVPCHSRHSHRARRTVFRDAPCAEALDPQAHARQCADRRYYFRRRTCLALLFRNRRICLSNYDFGWRNGIFKTLVENRWPVILEQAEPYFDSPAAFVYYFAFWLPAALIGKVFGLSAGIHFQFIWALIGILLVFYFIMAARERLSLMPVFVSFFQRA